MLHSKKYWLHRWFFVTQISQITQIYNYRKEEKHRD